MVITDKRKQYEFIYDTACEYLDNQFNTKNICDFKNNKCIANREHCTNHDTMGCCYSFEYAGFFDLRLVKNVKLCEHMKNQRCETKNITCKLYTCKYIKSKRNIGFDSHKILILDYFFNKKQHYIIQSNYFKTREQILDKLEEDDHTPMLWYLAKNKYRI